MSENWAGYIKNGKTSRIHEYFMSVLWQSMLFIKPKKARIHGYACNKLELDSQIIARAIEKDKPKNS